MLKSAVLIILCIFLIKLYPKCSMVLNDFNNTRLYGDNKIWGTFTLQKMQCFEVGDKVILLMRPFLSLVLHMCENIEQIMHYSWNNCLIYKKIKIFYIQKSTVHYVTLILDDPLYISNFDTRKVMSFFSTLACTYYLHTTFIMSISHD